MTRRAQHGFTLVETMVALAIFSLVAISGVVILRLSINSQEQLQRSSDMAGEFHIARSLIKADLAQIVPRLARDSYGDVLPGPVAGGNYALGGLSREAGGERLLLALVRGGNINPASRYPRSGLQYVEYLVVEDSLIRRVRNYPDGVEDTPASERVLFSGASDVEIGFLVGDRWTDRFLSGSGGIAPAAMRLSFVHPVLGDIDQLFHVGSLTAMEAGS